MKSGFSRRSNKSKHSKCSNRVQSANRHARPTYYGEIRDKISSAVSTIKSELTQQNIRDFEERLSSKAAARKREKIVFSDKYKAHKEKNDEQIIDEILNRDTEKNKEELEGEGEGEGENEEENPNEAENIQESEKGDEISIKSRSEIQSMSKVSRKSYVYSLRKELMQERKRREKLEQQVQELIESRKGQ